MAATIRVLRHMLFPIAGLALLCTSTATTTLPLGVVDARPRAMYAFKMTAPVESNDLAYQDETVKMAFTINRSAIVLFLSNLAKGAIKVNWGEVAYVDPEGQSHNMTHSRQPS